MPELSEGSDEVIGESGTGSFTQFGGSKKVTTELSLAESPGPTGTYTLSAGSLTVSGNESIGTPAPAPVSTMQQLLATGSPAGAAPAPKGRHRRQPPWHPVEFSAPNPNPRTGLLPPCA